MKKFSISNVNFKSYKLVIFDLDNTLYDENLYLFKAYNDIAKYLEIKYNIFSTKSYDFLKNSFLTEGRSNLFNKLFNEFKIPSEELKECLKIMRGVKFEDKIPLFTQMVDLVVKASKNCNVCVLTNGNVVQQKNKVEQIDWQDLPIQNFYYANHIKPKPSPLIFKKIIIDFNLSKNDNVLMVGDNSSDKEFAENIDSDFILIEKDRF